MPAEKVRVAILDDHQSIIDGYTYRFSSTPEIEVVATATYGEELEPLLSKYSVDVLLLDLSVRTSAENSNPFPIIHIIPKLLQKYSNLSILVISMFAEPGLMRSLIEAGASGYVLKDDQAAFRELGNVVLSVAHGGIYFSKKAHSLYAQADRLENGERLTPRQLEVISLCAAYPDASTSDLAEMMSISNSTVRNLLSSLYLRLGVHSRTAAVEKARELGLVTPRPPSLAA
ncbi:MAG TPA: response regulator transcription factor [Anaerolineales bacterium]|jgi:DNA-binding NarL/FixJ family response regulator|nr:response regulator transcription factor [Anaerolineales bacterium]